MKCPSVLTRLDAAAAQRRKQEPPVARWTSAISSSLFSCRVRLGSLLFAVIAAIPPARGDLATPLFPKVAGALPQEILAEAGGPVTIPLLPRPGITAWSLAGIAGASLTPDGRLTFTPGSRQTGTLTVTGTFGEVCTPFTLGTLPPFAPILGGEGFRWWTELPATGNGSWVIDNEGRYAWPYSRAASGPLCAAVQGPGRLFFHWRDLPVLHVRIDEQPARSFAASATEWNAGWVDVSEGSHVVRFSQESGHETRLAGVRLVRANETRPLIRQGWETITIDPEPIFRLQLTSDPPATSWSAVSLPSQLHLHPVTGVLSGQPWETWWASQSEITLLVKASRGGMESEVTPIFLRRETPVRPDIVSLPSISVAAGEAFSIPVTITGPLEYVSLWSPFTTVRFDVTTRTLYGQADVPGSYSLTIIANNGPAQDWESTTLNVFATLAPDPALTAALGEPGLVWSTPAAPVGGWRAVSSTGAEGGSDAVASIPGGTSVGAAITMETHLPGASAWRVRWSGVSLFLTAWRNGAVEPAQACEIPYQVQPDGSAEGLLYFPEGDWRVQISLRRIYNGYQETGAVIHSFTRMSSAVFPPSLPASLAVSAGDPVSLQFYAFPAEVPLTTSVLPAGLIFDPLTGLLTGNVEKPGVYPITFTATLPGGSPVTHLFTLEVTEGPAFPSFAEALDTPGRTWEHVVSKPGFSDSPDGGWHTLNHYGWEGSDAAYVMPAEGTSLSTIITGPCVASWRWLDTGGNGRPGFSLTSAQGGESSFIAGTDGPLGQWNLAQVAVPAGPHTLTFIHQFGTSDEAYTPLHRIYVDDFRLSTDGRPMISLPANWPDPLTYGRPWSFPLSLVTGQRATWTATGLPDGITINSETGHLSGTPVQSGQFQVRVTATRHGDSHSLIVPLLIEPSLAEAIDSGPVTWVTTTTIQEAVPPNDSGWHSRFGIGVGAGEDDGLLFHGLAGHSGTLSATLAGPDVLSFLWRGNVPFTIAVDGVVHRSIVPPSGGGRGRTEEVSIPAGTHEVVIRLTGAGSSYFDQFRLDSDGLPRVRLTGEPRPVVRFGQTVLIPVTVINGPAAITFNGLPEGLAYDPAQGAIVGTSLTPPSGGDPYPWYRFVITATSATGTTRSLYDLEHLDDPRPGLDVPPDTLLTVTPGRFYTGQFSSSPPYGAGNDDLTLTASANTGPAVLTIPVTGPGAVSIRHQVSFAPNYSILLDSTAVIRGTSAVNWLKAIIVIPPGQHEVKVECLGNYVRLDDLRFSHSDVICDGPHSSVHLPIGEPASVALTSLGLPGTWSAEWLPPGLTLNPLTGVIAGSPTRGGIYSGIPITQTNGSLTDSLFVEIIVDDADLALQTSGTGIVWTHHGFQHSEANSYSPNGTAYFTNAATPPDGAAFLSTTLAGPGQIGWQWSGAAECLIDGVSVTRTSGTAWQSGWCALTPGPHHIEWRRLPGSPFPLNITGIAPCGFTAWATSRGLSPTLALDSDSDHDGLNLMGEYAWQQDPSLPSGFPTVPLQPFPSQGAPLLDWAVPDVHGIRWIPETSDDLALWSTSGLRIERFGSHLRLHHAPSPRPRAFYRLSPQFE